MSRQWMLFKNFFLIFKLREHLICKAKVDFLISVCQSVCLSQTFKAPSVLKLES